MDTKKIASGERPTGQTKPELVSNKHATIVHSDDFLAKRNMAIFLTDPDFITNDLVVYSAIFKNPQSSQGELATITGLSTWTVRRAARMLQSKGIITIEKDGSHSRHAINREDIHA